MHTKIVLAIPLTALFTSLLSACPTFSTGCGDVDSSKSEQKVELSPEEHAQWQQGMMPAGDSEAPTTSASATGTGTTGDGTTGDGTGTGTGGTSTGESLSADEVCTAVCEDRFGSDLDSCSVDEQADKVVVTCTLLSLCVGGRGHACVRPPGAATGQGAGATWLARIAHDEAASVHAFRALARELAALGAPAQLLARVESAALDEVRHATVMSSLARTHGAQPTPPTCVSLPVRGLLEIAIENAVEGCVHETWAALSAAHQARRAVDPALRIVFAGIAEDEARHAELAWTIDAWLVDQLCAADRATVVAARDHAARELVTRLGTAVDEPAILELGVPRARVAAHLCAALGAALWSRAA